MIKRLFLLCVAFCLVSGLSAQINSKERLLNPEELARQPWFYDLDSALANPNQVYKLSLEGQKIKHLPPEFGSLKNLQVLNLSNTKLKEIPVEIEGCENLQILSIYNNHLRYLPRELTELKHLEVLYLGRNRLTTSEPWFQGLYRLRRLDLSMNPITPLDIRYIKNMLPRTDITF